MTWDRAVGAWASTEHGSELVAVEGFPTRKQPFYTLTTGGQRLHRYADHRAARVRVTRWESGKDST